MGAFKYQKRYRELHQTNPKWFSGALKPQSVLTIAELVKAVGAKTMLDFGSGKGYQYLRTRIHEQWGGILPTCYDPGVIQLQEKPKEGTKFDGVICTDVMEHIAEDDIDGLLNEIFSYVNEEKGFVYFAICCRPARKVFSDGINVHLTVRAPNWWMHKLKRFKRKGLEIKADFEVKDDPNSYDEQPERV
jgi:hypothetical protein